MEKILKYSTVGYALLILFGYSYLDTYYNYWDINIYSYLDASEILLVFLKSAAALTFGFIGAAIVYLIPVAQLIEKSSNNIAKLTNSPPRKKGIISMIILIIIILAGIIYITISNIELSKLHNYELAKLPIKITLIGLVAIVVYFWLPNLKTYHKAVELVYLRAILIILTMYWINHLTAIIKYQQVKNKITLTSVHFNYESIAYQTNDTLIYIGATSKYIYLNNQKSQTNYIFEKENIRNFEITKVK